MERIKEWDFIKGVLIFCVIYGHINAYLTPPTTNECFNYSPTIVIRLFQMPLFILVSGLFCKPVNNLKDYIKTWKKYVTRLIIPYLTWCLILTLVKEISQNTYTTFLIDFRESLGLLWFIPMLLISHFLFTTYSLLLGKWFNEKSVLVLLILHITISMMIPVDICNFFFLFPFYIAGYFFKKVNMHVMLKRMRGGYLFFLFLAFVISVKFPNEWTFYENPNYLADTSFNSVLFVVIRYICYSVVTLAFLLLLIKIYEVLVNCGNKLNGICQIGKEETLFLYLSHISLLYYTLRVFVQDNEFVYIYILENQLIRGYIVSIVVTALIVILLTILFKILSRSVITKKLFIGI